MNFIKRVFSDTEDVAAVMICRWLTALILFLICGYVFLQLSILVGIPTRTNVDDFVSGIGIMTWYLVFGPFFVIIVMSIAWKVIGLMMGER